MSVLVLIALVAQLYTLWQLHVVRKSQDKAAKETDQMHGMVRELMHRMPQKQAEAELELQAGVAEMKSRLEGQNTKADRPKNMPRPRSMSQAQEWAEREAAEEGERR